MTLTQYRPYVIHVVMIMAVLGIGIFIGTQTPAGEWYDGLKKAWFTPPGWVFGPVWTVLYILIGWVGARKILYGGQRLLWVAQMVLNFAWSPVFFGLHLTTTGAVIIVGMLFVILDFIRREWRSDRTSALMFLPYAVWVTLAAAVNIGVVVLNDTL